MVNSNVQVQVNKKTIQYNVLNYLKPFIKLKDNDKSRNKDKQIDKYR